MNCGRYPCTMDGRRKRCDASSIATGVVVEIGGLVVEDVTWLRKKMIIIISTWLRWMLF